MSTPCGLKLKKQKGGRHFVLIQHTVNEKKVNNMSTYSFSVKVGIWVVFSFPLS